MILKITKLSPIGGPTKQYPNLLYGFGVDTVFKEHVAALLFFNGRSKRSEFYMVTQFCQVGDLGIPIVVQFLQPNGTPLIVSSATALTIRIGYPDGTSADFDAELYTDGSDGKILYITDSEDDLAQEGVNTVQGILTIGSTVKMHGSPEPFGVEANIVDPVVPGP